VVRVLSPPFPVGRETSPLADLLVIRLAIEKLPILA